MVDTRTGYHLWSEMYDRELEDVFAIQNEISRAIIARLRVSLGGSDPSLVVPPTTSVEAYHSYLRGRYFWNRPSQEGLLKAVEHFQRAISSAPDYASAHSGLADSYYVLAVYGVLQPLEISPLIRTAALRAVELDPNCAEGHVSLGCAAMCFDWEWDAAVGHFQRAIELDPTYAHAHYQSAWCLTAMGRAVEAVAAARRAAELEPFSLHIQAYVAEILGMCRRFDAAVEQARSTLELDAGFIAAIEALGHAYTHARRYDEALTTLRRVPPSSRVSQALRLAPLYARLGEVELARHTLDDEEARLASGPAHAGNAGFYLASGALGLGDIERCLFWLERLVEERRFVGCLLKADPSWDDIRSHPHFLALLQRLRLA
jgi:tetratricopeptide (TPR) repeat protein